ATPERVDGQDALLPELIGPIVYRREIKEVTNDLLAPYHVERLYVELTAEDQERYQAARERYRSFVQERGISMASPAGWQRFIWGAPRPRGGRAGSQAFREHRRWGRAAPAKLPLLERLLERHRHDRVLIFTADNATVYRIARQFLVPAITYQTKTKERRKILQ